MYNLVQIGRLLMPIIAGWWMARSFGLLPTIVISLLVSTMLPAIGSVLLRTVEPETVTWRNLVAGWMLPWGYRIGNGKLSTIAVISGVVWLLLFALGISLTLSDSVAVPITSGGMSSFVVNLLLVLAWLVDGSAFFYLLGMMSRNSNFSRPPGSTQLKLLAIIGLLIAVSLAFWIGGRPAIALQIAGYPPLVVGVFTGAWCILIVIMGKNARWN